MKQFKFLILFITSTVFAQQPNDCVNAITICGNGTFSSNSSGIGTVQEVAGCSGMEHNSIWLKINIVNGGTLGFNLTPNNTNINVDYDFWVYGANRPCNNLGSPIRCCTTNPAMAGLTSNVTGMAAAPLTTTSGPGANGTGFVRWLTVNPGEFYYIAIDRPVGDGGFQLQWTGTAMDTGGAFPVPPSANSIGEVRACSNLPNQGIFDLNSLRPQINSDLVNNTISFHLNVADATDGTSPLPNIYPNGTNPQTIYARVKNNLSGCFTITSFQLKVYQVPSASISTTTPIICANQNGTVTFNGTPNAIIEYNVNNGATQTATLDASGVFQITSPLASTTTYKLIQVKIVDTNNATLCNNVLNSSVTITVSSPAPPTISNVGNICSDGIQTLTFNGLANAVINYTINAGANQSVVLDGSGQQTVNLSGLTPGNFTVLITSITESTPPFCTTNVNITSTFSVQGVLFADVAVNNSAVCSGSSVVVTFTGTPNTNVTYTVNNGSNQTIALNNSGTASITTSALTSNQVYQLVDVYTISPNCIKLENDAVTITIISQPSVTSFTGTTAICSGTSTNLNFTGTPNATVTYFDGIANQTVLLDNSGNGLVTVSPTTTTTYSLVNISIATTPVCSSTASGNVTITVNNAPQAGADGAMSICETSATTIDLFSLISGEQAGGVWTRTSGTGGTFDPATGTFLPSIGATSSTFTYTLSGTAPCVTDSSVATITINSQPQAGDGGNLVFCETDSSVFDLYSFITGEQSGGTWTRTSGTGGIFDPVAGTFTFTAGVTNSSFTYTLIGTAPCVNDSSVVSFTIVQQSNAGSDGNLTVCSSSTSSIDLFSLITGEQAGGVWTRTGGSGGVFNAAAGTFAPATGTSAINTFTYTLTGTAPCVNDSSVATVNLNPQPTAGADGNTTICDNSVTPINLFSLITGEQAGGTWTQTSGAGGTFDPVTGTFTPALGATTSTFTYTLVGAAPCVNDSSIATVNINPIPTNISISGGTGTCAGVPVVLNVTATAGTTITWTGTPSSFVIPSSGTYPITVSPTATTTYSLVNATLNGCTIPATGSTTVTVSPTPQFVTQIPDETICDGEQLDIASQLTSTVPGTTYTWNASANNLNLPLLIGDETNIDQIVDLVNNLENGYITLAVRPKFGNCYGAEQQIFITIRPIPVITSVGTPQAILCNSNNNNVAEIDVDANPNGTTFTWQVNTATNVQIIGGATSGTSTTGNISLPLALIDPLVPGTISFNITPINGICTGATQTNAISFTVNPIPGTPIPLADDTICSGEPLQNFTITTSPSIAGTILEYEVIDSQNVSGATFGSGPEPLTIADNLINTSDVQGYVVYRVKSSLGNCDGAYTDYTIFVDPLPKPDLADGHICVNATTGNTFQSYILDTHLNNPNYDYDWYVFNTVTNQFDPIAGATGSTYEVTEPGEYKVVVTNLLTNCSGEDTATVIEVFPATGFTTTVTDAFTNSATITITVNPLGTGTLVYSLDGGAWQTSNVFTGVEAGSHDILITDLEGCTNMSDTITVIDYPKYFTPNGDGHNEYWNIVGLDVQHNAKIYIFDRYGKLIKQIDPLSATGWDGTYNGQQVPSTDYWFSVDYTENEQQKQFKAHFTLKR